MTVIRAQIHLSSESSSSAIKHAMRSHFARIHVDRNRLAPRWRRSEQYHRPSSSAKFRKYVCPFTSNSIHSPPVPKRNARQKQATVLHGLWTLAILDDARGSSSAGHASAKAKSARANALFLVLYIDVLRVDHAFIFLLPGAIAARSRAVGRPAAAGPAPPPDRPAPPCTSAQPACARPWSGSRGPCPSAPCRCDSSAFLASAIAFSTSPRSEPEILSPCSRSIFSML